MTVVVGLVAAVGWVLAQAQYLNDYRTSGALLPIPEPTGGRPAYLDGPWTVGCEYDGGPTTRIVDPLPFIGAIILAAVVVGIGVAVLRYVDRGDRVGTDSDRDTPSKTEIEPPGPPR